MKPNRTFLRTPEERERDRAHDDALARRAWRAYQQGIRGKDLAARFGVGKQKALDLAKRGEAIEKGTL